MEQDRLARDPEPVAEAEEQAAQAWEAEAAQAWEPDEAQAPEADEAAWAASRPARAASASAPSAAPRRLTRAACLAPRSHVRNAAPP
jgi:hypothetical protein